MHQSFDHISDEDRKLIDEYLAEFKAEWDKLFTDGKGHIIFDQDAIKVAHYRQYHAEEQAANLMTQKLREGKVVLVGDVFVDKTNHRDPFPNPNVEMDLFTDTDTLETVEPFDFDKYNGIKR